MSSKRRGVRGVRRKSDPLAIGVRPAQDLRAASPADRGADIAKLLGSADGKAALVAQGMEGEPGPPAAVSERIRTDIRKWREVAASAGIHAE